VVKYRPDVFAGSEEADDIDDIQSRQRILSTSNDGFIETLNFLIDKGLERDPKLGYPNENLKNKISQKPKFWKQKNFVWSKLNFFGKIQWTP